MVQGESEHMRRELLWWAKNLLHLGYGVPVVLTSQRAGMVLRRTALGLRKRRGPRPRAGLAEALGPRPRVSAFSKKNSRGVFLRRVVPKASSGPFVDMREGRTITS